MNYEQKSGIEETELQKSKNIIKQLKEYYQ